MTTIASNFLLFFILFTFISPSTAFSHIQPNALVLPITQDSTTNQYITLIHQRTPLVPIKLTLDLSGQFLWINCEEHYVSSSYQPIHCNTPQCSITKSKTCRNCFYFKNPGCNINTCNLYPNNVLTHTNEIGEVSLDVIAVHSTDGSKLGQQVTVKNFLFTCGRTNLLKGLANGVNGMAGFGRSEISLPSLFSSALSFQKKFAICLSSSKTKSSSVLFFGDGPYVFFPRIDVSKFLIFTPLIKNPDNSAGPFFHGSPAGEYFIGVKGIRINEKHVSLNTSLLSIGDEGEGGTKISTLNPYTIMETSIHNAFVDAFAREFEDVPKAKAVKPFKLCYKLKDLSVTRVDFVPTVDFVLQNKDVFWRMFGANSMMKVSCEVYCVAFVDGGVEVTTSIVIGGYQLHDNLLEFDLENSRLGFSSSLLFRKTTCANFNFTSIVLN